MDIKVKKIFDYVIKEVGFEDFPYEEGNRFGWKFKSKQGKIFCGHNLYRSIKELVKLKDEESTANQMNDFETWAKSKNLEKRFVEGFLDFCNEEGISTKDDWLSWFICYDRGWLAGYQKAEEDLKNE